MLKFVDENKIANINSEYIVVKGYAKNYNNNHDKKKECIFSSEKIFLYDKEWEKYPFEKEVFKSYVPCLNKNKLEKFVDSCLEILSNKGMNQLFSVWLIHIYFYDKYNSCPKYCIEYNIVGDDFIITEAKDLRKKDEEELLLI